MRRLIPKARSSGVEGPGHEIYVAESEECLSAFLKFSHSLG